MFTGIVEAIGTVKYLKPAGDGVVFTIEAPGFSARLKPGDSVSINGVCQTVERAGEDDFCFRAVGETLKRTTFSKIGSGARVNLERAVSAGAPLGGHMVQGHVDVVGRVLSFNRVGKDRILTVQLDESSRGLVVAKGSIAIDGVSLTVLGDGGSNRIQVTVVPYTMEHTIAGGYKPGTRVNVEYDIIGKYVQAFLMNSSRGNRGI